MDQDSKQNNCNMSDEANFPEEKNKDSCKQKGYIVELIDFWFGTPDEKWSNI